MTDTFAPASAGASFVSEPWDFADSDTMLRRKNSVYDARDPMPPDRRWISWELAAMDADGDYLYPEERREAERIASLVPAFSPPRPNRQRASEAVPDPEPAPEPAPEPETAKPSDPTPPLMLRLKTAADVLDAPDVDPEWIVPGLVARGAVTTVGGYVGSGKTPLLLRLSAAVLGGHTFLGVPTWATGDFRIVYLTEEPSRSFAQAVRSAGITRNMAFEVALWDENSGLKWDPVVEQAATRARGGLLIVDTAFFWAAPSGIGAENDPSVMQDVYKPLTRATTGETAVVATAHTVKSFDRWSEDEADISAIRGSGAVVASSSVVVLYKKLKDDPTGDTRFLRVGRSRFGDRATDRYVELAVDGMHCRSGLQVMMHTAEQIEAKVIDLIAQLQPATNAQARAKWSGDVRVFDQAVRDLHSTGRLDRAGRGVRGDPYLWSVPPEAA